MRAVMFVLSLPLRAFFVLPVAMAASSQLHLAGRSMLVDKTQPVSACTEVCSHAAAKNSVRPCRALWKRQICSAL